MGTLAKAGDILDAVELGPQDLSDLSAITGMPRATCHRIAATLIELRLLDRNLAGEYVIGPRIAELATAADADRWRAAALPTLRRLRDQTGESAQLYRRRGESRLCVASVEPQTGLRDTVPEGQLLTMSAGSAAQVLAAWSDAPNDFEAKVLREVRRRGWAHSIGEREEGVASVSAPIKAGDRVVAAVSISGPSVRLSRQQASRLSPHVLAAADEVAATLAP